MSEIYKRKTRKDQDEKFVEPPCEPCSFFSFFLYTTGEFIKLKSKTANCIADDLSCDISCALSRNIFIPYYRELTLVLIKVFEINVT